MAFVHGKDTYISLDGNDLSTFTNTSTLDQESDEHDVTTYGKDDYVVTGGLLKGAFSMGGVYDDTASGPKAVIEPLIRTVVTLIRRAEGTGAGLPQESVSVLVKKYTETSPVADMITWSCEMTKSDAITRTTQ
ncbi:hypothetical protein QTQ03_16685 [Micromonospora sp. WMMA1363]|uniref:hypothetical protein n=1 Tax=Micromonospora sp. WMMA1363 TaxID=3053985 RepID=UPI00259C7630|nr:hypothetical protein [Micromonospora sp. WMMA1363]MDM4721156.1 hypothetical protein [Micromonospora sp. WMMA1363]